MASKTFDERGHALMAWLECPVRRLVAAVVLTAASVVVSSVFPLGWAR